MTRPAGSTAGPRRGMRGRETSGDMRFLKDGWTLKRREHIPGPGVAHHSTRGSVCRGLKCHRPLLPSSTSSHRDRAPCVQAPCYLDFRPGVASAHCAPPFLGLLVWLLPLYFRAQHKCHPSPKASDVSPIIGFPSVTLTASSLFTWSSAGGRFPIPAAQARQIFLTPSLSWEAQLWFGKSGACGLQHAAG